MKQVSIIAVCAMAGLGVVGTATSEETSEAAEINAVFADACSANGIDPAPCECIVQSLLPTHGADAVLAVGLEMVLRYDEAEAIKAQLGEDAVMNASWDFDTLQNSTCSATALAGQSGDVSGAASAAAIAAEDTDSTER